MKNSYRAKTTESNNLVTTQKRLLAVSLLVAFLFCALVGRLFFLQIVQGRDLQSKAVDQWTRDLPLKALRGKMLDANGLPLAESYTTYSVYVRPKAVVDKEGTAAMLSAELKLDYDSVYKKIGQTVSEVTLAKQVEDAVVQRIKDTGRPGIYFGETSTRDYPNGNFLSQVLGITNIDSAGSSGLERYYENYLKGVDGLALTQTDISGIELGGKPVKYIPSIPGMSLNLTVDQKIQRFAEDAVADAYKTYSPAYASCIVMDVKTGGIAAMATTPGYDLNDPPRDDIPLLNSLSKNKMITDVYEPGSTFKIFTTAAALEEGLTKETDRFYCPGYRVVDGKRIKCWKTIGHGSQTLIEGVQNSCNCVFMDLAQRLGTEKFYKYVSQLGFGKSTGIDFSGESKGIIMPSKSVKTVDLVRMGFGQAIAVTPVQLLTGVSSIVNGGTRVTPHFVDSVTSYDKKDTFQVAKPAGERIISAETSRRVSEMLERVVSVGGGKQAQVNGYKIGGKTGTAQKYANGIIAQGKYVSSFVGFGPVEDPRYAVLFIVDEPKGYVYYGSLVAAPYAGKIFNAVFNYKNIAPTCLAEDEIANKPVISMPALVGLSLTEAASRLAALGLQYELAGEDGLVSAQTPAAGTMLPKNAVVLVKIGSGLY